MPYTREWDEGTPPGTAGAADLDEFIQHVKTDFRERIEQVIPGWTNEDEDPKRAVILVGDTASRPAVEDAHLGEWYWDTEDNKLFLFDGVETWVLVVDFSFEEVNDFTQSYKKASLNVNTSTVSNEVSVHRKLVLDVIGDATQADDGEIEVDLDLLTDDYDIDDLIQATARATIQSVHEVSGRRLFLQVKFLEVRASNLVVFKVFGYRRSGTLNDRISEVVFSNYLDGGLADPFVFINNIANVRFTAELEFTAPAD